MTDGSGLPLAFTLTPGQRHEMSAFERTLEAVRLPGLQGRPRTRPKYLAGDKACSYRPVFASLRRRRIRPVIPPRQGGNMGKGCPRRFDPDLYRKRMRSSAVSDGSKAAAQSRPGMRSSPSTSAPC